MGQRGEVAAATDRAVARHKGGDLGIQHRYERLGHDRPDARQTHGERSGPQEHGRAHHLAFDGRAHPGGMRTDQGQLQLGLTQRSNPGACQRSEAGRNTVDRLARRRGPLDAGPAALHPGACRGRKRDLLAVTGNVHDLPLGQPSPTQRHRHDCDASRCS